MKANGDNNLGILTRYANKEDIDALVNLMDSFYSESSYLINKEKALSSFCFYIDNPEFGTVIVAQSVNKIIGYVIIKYYYAMSVYGFALSIEDLFIASEYRQKGAASKLMELVQKNAEMKGIKDISVEVGRKNSAAVGLYEKFGFAERNDDILTMELSLDLP